MTTVDLILLDTNVLVYGQEKQSGFFESSRIILEGRQGTPLIFYIRGYRRKH